MAWRDCSPAGYDCATVTVPLDYEHPTGRTIDLALKRHRAGSADRIGSVFFNPGGPGGSGLDALPSAVNDMSSDVQRRFDIVTWDPRGVGASAPIDCDGGVLDLYAQDLTVTPMPPAAEAAAKRWAQLCQERSGDVLPFVGTNDVAQDLDVLREAVGDEKLTYVGVSYGTEIGLVYAQRYPTRIRAMILDGVVDPTVDPDTANVEQSAAVDHALDQFIAWCKATTTCDVHEDPAGALDELQRVARSGTLRGVVGGNEQTLSPTLAALGVVVATYDSSTWPYLATAISDALAGRPALLATLVDSYVSAASAGDNAAVSCLDSPRPTAEQLDALAARAARVAPRTGAFNANSEWICTFWPVAPKPVPRAYDATGAPTIMVWGTTGDNATPYKNAVHIASVLEHARLVTLDADRHAAIGANACVERAQGAYLTDLEIPPAGTRC